MDAATYPREDVKKLLGTMVCMKINPEASKANKKIGDQFHVDSYPRLLLIAPNGDVISTSRGEPESDKFGAACTEDAGKAMNEASRATPPNWSVVAKNAVVLLTWFPQSDEVTQNSKWFEQIGGLKAYRDAFAEAKAAHERMILAAKAPAQLQLGKKKEAIETWKALATTYPDTPEAAEATKQLTKLHVKLEPLESAPEQK
jgi:hypothetical protein